MAASSTARGMIGERGGAGQLERNRTGAALSEEGDGGGTPAARTGKMTRLKVRKVSAPPMQSEVVRRGVPTEGAMMAVEAAFR
jgi:ribosomal protein S8E